MATGCLSDSQVPRIPGRDTFAGDWYHTARWPHHGVDFTGKRVAVIGTGSSGIQSIPVIAAGAAHTYVLQRTPQYSIPAHNRPLDPIELRTTQENYAELRQKMRESFVNIPFEFKDHGTLEATDADLDDAVDAAWAEGGFGILLIYPDQLFSVEAAERVGKAAWNRIRATIHDPAVAARLRPRYPFGAKRLCLDTGYFETFNREDVTLVDLRDGGIEAIVPEGIRTAQRTVEVDVIVFATGFDAMTGSILKVAITGRGGQTIQDKWAAGPRNYLGLMVAGFPNLFTVTGPGSPSVIGNMVPTIEQHVDWIADSLGYLTERGIATMEASLEAEAQWVAQNDLMANATIFPTASSWYMGRNIAGKPEGFMPFAGGTVLYRETCDEVTANDYKGFILGSPAAVDPAGAVTRAVF
jgi:cyclohexanone monooxygenase